MMPARELRASRTPYGAQHGVVGGLRRQIAGGTSLSPKRKENTSCLLELWNLFQKQKRRKS